ncbi:PAS domain S-box protein [bacterium]|nr:PAS domain S-box protein [bacterium]
MDFIIDWSKKKTVILTRWLVIIVISYLIIFSQGYQHFSFISLESLLIVFLILSNIFFLTRDDSFFSRRFFDVTLYSFDITMVTFGILLARVTEVDFYILFFLEIIIIGLANNLINVVFNAILICAIYAFFLSHGEGRFIIDFTQGGIVYKADYLLRIPLLFIVALFFGTIITKVKQKTKEVKDLSKKCHLILSSTPDMVISTNRDGEFTFASPSAKDLTGCPPDALVADKNIFDRLIIDGDKSRITTLIRNLSKAPEQGEIEFRINHTAKGIRWLRMLYAPLIDEQGNQIGIQGSMRDVTDLKESQEAVIRSACHTSMGKLAFSMAQEINNPLQVIKNMIYKIGENVGNYRTDKNDLDMIKEGATRIENIVQKILWIYQSDISERVAVDIHYLLQKALSITKNRMKIDHIQIKLTFHPKEIRVLAIPNRLYEAFTNIILNSIEAISNGGEISISTSLKGRNVEIRFSDTGQGISARDIDHIFEPFYTTKKRKQACGLGLTVCYWILNDLGGNIRVQSLEGKGATFILTLPVCNLSEKPKEGRAMEVCYA